MTAGFLIVHIHLLQYHNIKNTERQKKLKFYTEIERAVAGVGTAILGFGTVSRFAFNFDQNNLVWGGKKTRDVSVTNIQGDRAASVYKFE